MDLTITTDGMASYINNWDICETESCSDHSIITFNIGKDTLQTHQQIFYGNRYVVKQEKLGLFDKNIVKEFRRKFYKGTDLITEEYLDRAISVIAEETDIGSVVNNFIEALTDACNKTFKTYKTSNRINSRKSVPWWTLELTLQRKKVNALRRRYQKTKNNTEMRETRKSLYLQEKRRYESSIRKEKFNSWKQFCTITPSTNPWNEVYKIASAKFRKPTAMTTLKKEDGSFTKDLQETMALMMQQFTPTDDTNEDNTYHRQVRKATEEPVHTRNEELFTTIEIQTVLSSMDHTKTPGDDDITSEILLRALKAFPKFITAIYNGCLEQGTFPKPWKKSRILPIIKPGKEESTEVSKFRPISLLSTGGKVLEKLLINRIMHYMYKKDFIHESQYGFTPQTSAIDAAMAVKEFIDDKLKQCKSIILVALDVKGAFDAAWWPAILKALKDSKCPGNLYKVSKNYFNQRTAVMSCNSLNIAKDVSKGCPQGSCCGPGFWNIQYNSLMHLQFTSHTKIVAFADDLLLLTEGSTSLEAENFSNIELRKVGHWAKDNKILFNEQKSQVILITRKLRPDKKQDCIYPNNKKLEQVNSIKYLGIFFDEKFTFDQHIEHITDN